MWNFEPFRSICPFPQKFFLCFCGILQNSVLAGDIGDKYSIFWAGSDRCAVYMHDFSMKYMTTTRALMGGILKILSWAYFSLFGRQTVSVSCSYRRHRQYIIYISSASGGHRTLITICGKFAALSHRIWQTGPWNLEKFATKNCGR